MKQDIFKKIEKWERECKPDMTPKTSKWACFWGGHSGPLFSEPGHRNPWTFIMDFFNSTMPFLWIASGGIISFVLAIEILNNNVFDMGDPLVVFLAVPYCLFCFVYGFFSLIYFIFGFPFKVINLIWRYCRHQKFENSY